MTQRILSLVLLGLLAVGSADAKVTLTRTGCIFEITWDLQLHGGDEALRLKVLQAAQECYGGKKIGECCNLTATVNVVLGGAPQAGYDQIQVVQGAKQLKSKSGGLNGGDGIAEWPATVTKEAIGVSLGHLAGVRPEVHQTEKQKTIPPLPPVCTRIPAYPPCRAGSKFYRSGGAIHKFHVDQLLQLSGEFCPESCCPQDQGSAGGSGGPSYSGQTGGGKPGVFFAAGAAVPRPSEGPVEVVASLGPGDFFSFDYRIPEDAGGGYGFGQATGTLRFAADATLDPELNPAMDPEEAAFMVTELEMSITPFDLEPGVSSGPNTITLPDMELIESGLVSPSYGFLVDKQAPAAPGLRRAASAYSDGWIQGYMGIKWVNDVFTEGNPAYFDAPVSGQLDYDTGTGFFGFFGGLVYFLDSGTAADEPVLPDRKVSLAQNHPNPFSAGTTIPFRVRQESRVTLRILDVQGRIVRTLVEDALARPGTYHKVWDAQDDLGRRASPGVYFSALTVDGERTTRRMVLMP